MVRWRGEAKGLSPSPTVRNKTGRHQDRGLAILACPGLLHRSLRPCLTGVQ